jgi:hypothetical protein
MTTSFKKSTLREYFESIVIAVILALFIRTFVVQAFKIPRFRPARWKRTSSSAITCS